jgi:hypothetical protein
MCRLPHAGQFVIALKRSLSVSMALTSPQCVNISSEENHRRRPTGNVDAKA